MAFLITPTIYLFVILINSLFINGEEMLLMGGGGGEEQFNNNNGMGGMHPTHIPNLEENKMPKNDEKFVGELKLPTKMTGENKNNKTMEMMKE